MAPKARQRSRKRSRKRLSTRSKASTARRLGRKLAAYSAATGAVAASAGGLASARDANAAVVYSGEVNIPIPQGTAGTFSSSAQGTAACTGPPPDGCTASATGTTYLPPVQGAVALDLDGVGGPDVTFARNRLDITANFTYPNYSTYIAGTFNALGVSAPGANGWIPTTTASGTFAAKLNVGDPIGPGQTFEQTAASSSMGTARRLSLTFDGTFSSSYADNAGPWSNGTGFIGLIFQSGPDTHYGWIRVRIDDPATLAAVIVDYAYETESDREAAVGFNGRSFVPLPSGASLGLIALGSLGIHAFRQRRKAAAD